MFAGTIGVRRLLQMFDKYNIKTTFFIPGHSLETFPEECRMIADKGHEIGLHGYSHENPIAMTGEQQTAIMDKVDHARYSETVMVFANREIVLSPHQRLSRRQASTRYRSAVVGVESRRR